MLGSEEHKLESTLTPPRPPSSRPQPRASSSRGRTPQETTTMSTSKMMGSVSPLGMNFKPLTLPPSSRTASWILAPLCTWMPRLLIFPSNALPASWLSCVGMRYGAISTTWLSISRSYTAFAASRPKRPPPITAARLDFFAAAMSASRSSIVLYTKTPSGRDAGSSGHWGFFFSGKTKPGVGGTKQKLPVQSTRMSYFKESASSSTELPP
mmetsp:Transcript_42368/g.87115  ORF Transcript_42368/g.87115 Transcript_42368/m.87115 type:complete len:210 (+) Transcript_42368:331-960(+)